jgi:hypothetical protein
MNEHDTILIQELTSSYSQQLIWYKELKDVVRKILSRLILSRGNMTELIAGLEKKQRLMECIETERKRILASVQIWQENKFQFTANDEVNFFNDILTKTSDAIKDFLDEEEKLKKYLEGIIKKDTQLQEETSTK